MPAGHDVWTRHVVPTSLPETTAGALMLATLSCLAPRELDPPTNPATEAVANPTAEPAKNVRRFMGTTQRQNLKYNI